ncbi:MAG: hypothetical protein AAGF11_34745 [Myxococcota bacterium]
MRNSRNMTSSRTLLPLFLIVGSLVGCDNVENLDNFDSEDIEADIVDDSDMEMPDEAQDSIDDDATDPEADAQDKELDLASGPSVAKLSGTHKLCSVVSPGHWRTDFLAPDNWTWHTCNSFRADVYGVHYQLGCITDTGYSLGPLGGGNPPNNTCGW